MEKHADYLENQKRMRGTIFLHGSCIFHCFAPNHLAMLCSKEKVSESLSKRKNHVETAASTGGLTIEEERLSKEKLGNLKRSLTLERKAMKKNQEKILTHQEAFEKLRVRKLLFVGIRFNCVY
jgi:hypothetical protein